MKKSVTYLCALVLANVITIAAFAQTSTITGKVENSTTQEAVPAVSVTIKDASLGTFTDDKGTFKIILNQPLPVTLLISSVGYEMQESGRI
jgi:IMP cyclohydrolase